MKVAKFEPPNVVEWVFMAAWIFEKFEGFVWKILLVSIYILLASNIFHTNLCNFLKIRTPIKNSLFHARGLKLCNFANLDALFSLLPSILCYEGFWWKIAPILNNIVEGALSPQRRGRESKRITQKRFTAISKWSPFNLTRSRDRFHKISTPFAPLSPWCFLHLFLCFIALGVAVNK